MEDKTKDILKEAGKQAIAEILAELQAQFEPLADKYRKYGAAHAKLAQKVALKAITGEITVEQAKESLDDIWQATELRLLQAALEAKAKEVELIHRSLMIVIKIVGSVAIA